MQTKREGQRQGRAIGWRPGPCGSRTRQAAAQIPGQSSRRARWPGKETHASQMGVDGERGVLDGEEYIDIQTSNTQRATDMLCQRART